ncbi:hypothetical protein CYMTET_54804 [Cymbomonas tetramitiformis]|uniref:Uncharacterized protein n=1 Tax=Cymbomonas tetramitiformis TaxID=36881 RepID=A0AAE0BE65_9CHLO|nr:hypothetical protein CYMTET_54804 [Cymbomonas tetramitiformis]
MGVKHFTKVIREQVTSGDVPVTQLAPGTRLLIDGPSSDDDSHSDSHPGGSSDSDDDDFFRKRRSTPGSPQNTAGTQGTAARPQNTGGIPETEARDESARATSEGENMESQKCSMSNLGKYTALQKINGGNS